MRFSANYEPRVLGFYLCFSSPFYKSGRRKFISFGFVCWECMIVWDFGAEAESIQNAKSECDLGKPPKRRAKKKVKKETKTTNAVEL